MLFLSTTLTFQAVLHVDEDEVLPYSFFNIVLGSKSSDVEIAESNKI
jgi:hypothetical protein